MRELSEVVWGFDQSGEHVFHQQSKTCFLFFKKYSNLEGMWWMRATSPFFCVMLIYFVVLVSKLWLYGSCVLFINAKLEKNKLKTELTKKINAMAMRWHSLILVLCSNWPDSKFMLTTSRSNTWAEEQQARKRSSWQFKYSSYWFFMISFPNTCDFDSDQFPHHYVHRYYYYCFYHHFL